MGDQETVSGVMSADHPKSSMLKLILGLAVLVTLFALLVLYLSPIICTEDIVGEAVTINAGSYVYYKFSVPSRVSNIYLQGGAISLSDKIFSVYVLDSTDFIRWENGQLVNPYLSIEYVTRAPIGIILSQDTTYYLVIDNRFSITSQTVSIQVTLTYWRSRFY